MLFTAFILNEVKNRVQAQLMLLNELKFCSAENYLSYVDVYTQKA